MSSAGAATLTAADVTCDCPSAFPFPASVCAALRLTRPSRSSACPGPLRAYCSKWTPAARRPDAGEAADVAKSAPVAFYFRSPSSTASGPPRTLPFGNAAARDSAHRLSYSPAFASPWAVGTPGSCGLLRRCVRVLCWTLLPSFASVESRLILASAASGPFSGRHRHSFGVAYAGDQARSYRTAWTPADNWPCRYSAFRSIFFRSQIPLVLCCQINRH